MATRDSTPEETIMSAPKQFVKACIQYDVISMVVDQLEDNMRTLSHDSLHAYNVQTMRPGLLVHYLKVWSARVVKSRKARDMVAGSGRKQANSIVHWAAHVAIGRSLPVEIEELICEKLEE